MWNFISGAISAVGEFFGFIKQRDAEYNTPAMIDNKLAKDDQKASDEHQAMIEKGDLNDIRKEAS